MLDTLDEFFEAFTIFKKYNPRGNYVMTADHDCIWVDGGDPTLISSAELQRLEQLGWDPDPDAGDAFRKFI